MPGTPLQRKYLDLSGGVQAARQTHLPRGVVRLRVLTCTILARKPIKKHNYALLKACDCRLWFVAPTLIGREVHNGASKPPCRSYARRLDRDACLIIAFVSCRRVVYQRGSAKASLVYCEFSQHSLSSPRNLLKQAWART